MVTFTVIIITIINVIGAVIVYFPRSSSRHRLPSGAWTKKAYRTATIPMTHWTGTSTVILERVYPHTSTHVQNNSLHRLSHT
uniref:Putative secreted protein n=1 Tax=Anopheles darlingi TaxID=43151 RepID=A0A2M4DQW6_ANODA